MPAKEPRFNIPKLEMSPPSMNPWTIEGLSPLRMSPPSMALPDFQPPDFKLPYLSPSKYFPPPSLYDEQLPLPPSVMSWGVADPTLLVVGTYAADGGNGNGQTLKAAVLFYRVPNTDGEVRGDAKFAPDPTRKKYVPKEVNLIGMVESPYAINDLSFSPHDPSLMVAVTAAGSLLFFNVPPHSDTINRISIQDLFPTPETILSLAFSASNPSILAVSLQSGVIAIIEYSRSSGGVLCEIKQRFQAHQGAARSVKFALNGQRLYSGGDDCVLRAWSLSSRSFSPSVAWQEDQSHGDSITVIQTWPYYRGGDKGHKRKLLLTGSVDGKMRVFDLAGRERPPKMVQEVQICKEPINRLDPLPGLPMFKETESKVQNGVFVPDDYDQPIELDEAHAGVIASCLDGQSRVVLQRQKFASVFITLKLPDIPPEEMAKRNRSVNGVETDWYGREKVFEWATAAEFREHDGSVTCGCGVALVDLDSIFKVDGVQQKRRGYRVASASYEDRKLCMYQVYIE